MCEGGERLYFVCLFFLYFFLTLLIYFYILVFLDSFSLYWNSFCRPTWTITQKYTCLCPQVLEINTCTTSTKPACLLSKERVKNVMELDGHVVGKIWEVTGTEIMLRTYCMKKCTFNFKNVEEESRERGKDERKEERMEGMKEGR